MKLLATAAAAAAVCAIAGLATVAPMNEAEAAFDRCKDVKISVKNSTGAPIQVYDLDYRDLGSNRWRSENISNRVISDGGSYKWKRTLEGVNNAKTFIRVQFRKLKSNGKWDRLNTWYANSKTVTCKKGKTIKVNFR
ncbi:hypothetical protein [Labrenzia sp. CE80]|uniref:hypothetical protein n=1 Tax=Labrenzia sp. CE80 TaxID=1788986 RepID=UPI00129ACAF4|nr:hypothetical protein [Labrenzia sp. CE80]